MRPYPKLFIFRRTDGDLIAGPFYKILVGPGQFLKVKGQEWETKSFKVAQRKILHLPSPLR